MKAGEDTRREEEGVGGEKAEWSLIDSFSIPRMKPFCTHFQHNTEIMTFSPPYGVCGQKSISFDWLFFSPAFTAITLPRSVLSIKRY